MSPHLLDVRGITKGFGGVQALEAVDLSLSEGEIHCLVGENGAGKSTLGKIIAGIVRPDQGTLTLHGESVDFRTPRDALARGITIVEQELALVPAMSVAENALLGLRKRGRRHVRELVDQYSLGLDIDAPVERLPASDQQKVEILRALARRARIVVMDEPTARLDDEESRNLLEILRRLAASGTGIVFVSHFLEHVLDVADTVTVLRNGQVVRSGPAAAESPDSLVTAMLGRAATLNFPAKQPPGNRAPTELEVRGLAGTHPVDDVSFTVRQGEIVGLAGLVGSGRTEVARMIFGADRRRAGEIEFKGRPVVWSSTRRAIDNGVAYLPESRKDLGLFMQLSSQENVTLSDLGRVSRLGFLSGSRERAATQETLNTLAVHPANPGAKVGTLSGGNQQKVLFAKWLWHQPQLLIADEPTRGVDVGAKFAIYEMLARLAADGLAILLISSELEEVVGLSHRVVVMSRGRSVAILDADQVCESKILQAAFGNHDTGSSQSRQSEPAPMPAQGPSI